jgi:hypothetical protein
MRDCGQCAGLSQTLTLSLSKGEFVQVPPDGTFPRNPAKVRLYTELNVDFQPAS